MFHFETLRSKSTWLNAFQQCLALPAISEGEKPQSVARAEELAAAAFASAREARAVAQQSREFVAKANLLLRRTRSLGPHHGQKLFKRLSAPTFSAMERVDSSEELSVFQPASDPVSSPKPAPLTIPPVIEKDTYLLLQNIVADYTEASILDLKMGWFWECP